MELNIVSFKPVISCYHTESSGKKLYYKFSPSSTYKSGKNLQSYSYSRNVDQTSGSFNFSIVESTDTTKKKYQYYEKDESGNYKTESGQKIKNGFDIPTWKNFLDCVEPLDVVVIEDVEGTVSFIGIVQTITFSAMASSGQKRISISGKSIDYLLEMLVINMDVAAMSWANSGTSNLDFKMFLAKNTFTQLGSKKILSYNPASVKDVINTSFKFFITSMKNYENVSSCKIIDMINVWYGGITGENIFEIDSSIEFAYPVTSNLFSDKAVKFIPYIRNLLPNPIYEVFGTVKDGKPVIIIRKNPFNASDWIKLPLTYADSEFLTDYTFNRSNTEVYTAFVSYVEGSSVDAGQFRKMDGAARGYASGETNADKVALYGYVPLECNFVGYLKATSDKAAETQDNSLTEKLKVINAELKDWYGHMDELYEGDFTVIDYFEENLVIGNRVSLCGIQFYLKEKKVSWTYGSALTQSFTVDRGGKYDAKGNFTIATGLSDYLCEVKQK